MVHETAVRDSEAQPHATTRESLTIITTRESLTIIMKSKGNQMQRKTQRGVPSPKAHIQANGPVRSDVRITAGT